MPHMTSAARRPETRNLVLITHPGRQDWRDFQAIGQEIAQQAPDIFGYIVSPKKAAETIPKDAWRRRSLIVSFGHIAEFVPPRGRVFQNALIPKQDEYRLFTAARRRPPVTTGFRARPPVEPPQHKPPGLA